MIVCVFSVPKPVNAEDSQVNTLRKIPCFKLKHCELKGNYLYLSVDNQSLLQILLLGNFLSRTTYL
ncbi:MAG TPA: hypothetical protein VGD26_07065, partial [Chitinophagaceae bacterium]